MNKEVDILYLHPTRNLNTTLYSFMPVGIIGLLNILKQDGYEVYGINYGVEKSLNCNYDLTEELKNISYKVLLIDLHWYEHSFGAIEIAELSKKLYPNIPVVIGGMTTTIFAKEILEKFDVVDYALKGDSEEPIKDLMDYLIKQNASVDNIENICYRQNGTIIDKNITYCCKDIDNIDNISDDFIKNNDKYAITNTVGVQENRKKNIWITVGRGCMYNCTYCDAASSNTNTLWGRKHMVCRSPEYVAQDIITAYNRGAEEVRITHDIEMLGEEYYKRVFDIVKKAKIKIGYNYECYQIPDKKFIDELLETFDKESVLIEITLLSANEKIRKAMGKWFSNKHFFESLDYLKNTKIIQRIFYSVNVDDETMNDFDETMEQIKYLVENYYAPNFSIGYQKVILDPLATIRSNKCCNIQVQLKTFMDYYNYCQSDEEEYIGYTDKLSDKYAEKIEKYNTLKQKFAEEGYYNIY